MEGGRMLTAPGTDHKYNDDLKIPMKCLNFQGKKVISMK
jgi:hypothetical protein